MALSSNSTEDDKCEDLFIYKSLAAQIGGSESARMFVQIDTSTGESEIVIEKTVSQRLPVTEIDKARDLYERLTCGRGRKIYKPEDLAL